ncbi:MAG: hypothetical protein LKCHEGNO_01364 [Burkholderiaceae bacterium]|nr:hypothetical protein [Burkholderiaceae bacterium]
MMARLQQSWSIGVLALAIAAMWITQEHGLPLWLSLAAALLVLNLHALALACEFVWLRRIEPGAGVPKPSLVALCRAWAGEVVTGVRVFGWRQPFRSRLFEDYLPAGSRRRGVLLLHGFVCNRGLWNPWMRRLRLAGAPFVAIDLEPAFGSIDQYVASIDAAVSRLEKATSLPPIIVAHSMGGLAARAWLRQSRDQSRVHSVVTIGTPHAGTWLARFALTPNGRQMREGNVWLRELHRGETASTHSLFTCYFGHCDNIVFPAGNAVLGGATNLHVPGIAHLQLAYHEPIFDDVLKRTRT